MKLYEFAKMIRSKNAGPFILTIDILFETEENYQMVLASGKLTPELISTIYEVPIESVHRYTLPLARAIKFSFPRKTASGDFQDHDVYGAQFHGPLVMLELTDEGGAQ